MFNDNDDHVVALANPNATFVQRPAQRIRRTIELMMRYWVDADMAAADMEERRLALNKGYLVNHLGLTMWVEPRVAEGMRPIQIHHLPRQKPQIVEAAIAKLSEAEFAAGVDRALRDLVNMHPHPDGSWPQKPGWTRLQAKMMGMEKANRGGEEGSIKMAVLKAISERWVSSRDWDKEMKTTRIAPRIQELQEEGYDICVDMRPNESGTGKPYASYRYFVDPQERAAWRQEHALRDFMKREHERQEAEAKEDERRKLREKKIIDGANERARRRGLNRQPVATVKPRAPLVIARPEREEPREVPKPIAARLQALGAPKVGLGGATPPGMQARAPIPVHEVDCAADVPAERLRTEFPGAKSREVVSLDGVDYQRKFAPIRVAGELKGWNASWVRHLVDDATA